jgi:hypothetical protein
MAAAAMDLEQEGTHRIMATSSRCPANAEEMVKSIFMGGKQKTDGENSPAGLYFNSGVSGY